MQGRGSATHGFLACFRVCCAGIFLVSFGVVWYTGRFLVSSLGKSDIQGDAGLGVPRGAEYPRSRISQKMRTMREERGLREEHR